jgi:hypothetical protein
LDPFDGGGGVRLDYQSSPSNFLLDSVHVTGNAAGACAGVLFGEGSRLLNSTVSGNQSSTIGGGLCFFGGLDVDNTELLDNSASAEGGAIFAAYGLLTITDSILNRNTGTLGGGVYLEELASLTSSTTAWGIGNDDNSPDDVYLSETSLGFMYDDSGTGFSCDTDCQ